MPQVRGDLDFYPQALEKGIRSPNKPSSWRLAEMYVQGVSTPQGLRHRRRTLRPFRHKLHPGQPVRRPAGHPVAGLAGAAPGRVSLPVPGCPLRKGAPRRPNSLDCAILIALGVSTEGKRTILGVSAALSEAEPHWRQFLNSLQGRGLHGLQLIVSDDHA